MLASRRILIVGSAGQLGSDLVLAAQDSGLNHVGLAHFQLDVTDAVAVRDALQRFQPQVVINCAALTNVEWCEENPAEAYRVNAEGALSLAHASREIGTRLVQISTDYVFSGDREPGTMYDESEPTGPVNIYGASKVAGEQHVAQTLEDHLIVRVSSLFGVVGARGKGGNFIETILKKGREGGPLKVVNDQWMTPTYTRDAAHAIVQLSVGDARGVLHVSNPESCTWHAFASEAVSLVGLRVPIEAIALSTVPSKVRRPRNSALRTDRLRSTLGNALQGWRSALRSYLTAKGHLN